MPQCNNTNKLRSFVKRANKGFAAETAAAAAMAVATVAVAVAAAAIVAPYLGNCQEMAMGQGGQAGGLKSLDQ